MMEGIQMVVADMMPLMKAPDSWPLPVTAVVAMTALAGLDLVGAYAAKEWAATRATAMLLLGVGAFLVLFWVYASALQYAELALVTLGWIVVLQVGLLLVDRFVYAVKLAPGQWVAVVVILAAQGYLLVAPHDVPAQDVATVQETTPRNESVMQPKEPSSSVQVRLSPLSFPPPEETPGRVEAMTHQSPIVR
jgi:hypothetical protein